LRRLFLLVVIVVVEAVGNKGSVKLETVLTLVLKEVKNRME